MVVELRKLCHRYRRGPSCDEVLKHVDLTVKQGEFVAIMGASGSGKSTLLHILGCLQQPSSGSYLLNGEDITGTSEHRLAEIRARQIGQIFQMFHLLPEMDVAQNIALPFLYGSCETKEIESRVSAAISQVGLEHRSNHKPGELSGGEMQRVAIARALAQQPELILADEPTGNLDENNSRDILELFTQMNRQGNTIIMVTHDDDVAEYAHVRYVLRDATLHRQ